MSTHKKMLVFMKIMVLFILLLLKSEYVQATAYYVSTATSASNSNSGLSIVQAWATPSYAAQMAQAGDTIYLLDGTWYGEHISFANSGTSSNPIVMKAYNGRPTLDGQNSGLGISVSNRQYIKIEGLKIYDYGDTGSDHSIVGINASYIIINNNEISHSAYQVFFQNSNNITITNNSISHTKYKNSIHILGDGAETRDVLIENNLIFDSDSAINPGGDVLDLHVASSGVLRRITFNKNRAWNGPEAIFCHNSGGMYEIKITNNWFDNFRTGLTATFFAGDPATNIIANNVITNITAGNGIAVQDTIPGYVTIKNNIITNISNAGIHAAGEGMYASYNLIKNVAAYYGSWGGYSVTVSGVNIYDVDPLFADPANRDFHLKSQYGRWNGITWVNDSVTSPAIDAGDPSDDYSGELLPNGGRINMGAYGNTAQASKSGVLETGNISGTVKDLNSNLLSGVTVSAGVSTQTDNNGNYLLSNVIVGSQQVSVSKSGYVTQTKQITVVKDSTVTLDFVLEISTSPAPQITAFSPANLTPIQNEGTTNTFSVTVDQPVTNGWSLDGVLQSETSQNFIKTWSYSDAGLHTITYMGTNTNGTVSQTWNLSVYDVVQGTSQTNEQKIRVYPNPYIKGESAGEKITFGNLPKEATIKIYNTNGESVKELASGAEDKAEWSISEIKSGVYLYVITSPEGTKKGKVSIIK